MQPTSIYPVIGTADIEGTAAFYVRHFGFAVTFAGDWYVSLRHGTAPRYELGVLDYAHASVPEAGRRPAAGVIINIEVEDADAAYEQLIRRDGLPLLRELLSEPWGQRHFITSDPNGVLIDVIASIPPTADYAALYGEAAG